MSQRSLSTFFLLTGILFWTSQEASARSRSQRTGFNFGTSLRLLDHDDRTNAQEETGKTTRSQTGSRLVTPYLGYSFGSISLGLAYLAESRVTSTAETRQDGTVTARHSHQTAHGGSLYGRFLFASVFFFETGIGLYSDTLDVTTENRTPQGDGAFAGASDSHQVKGTGPGFHAGIGLELPIASGFFFTSQYQVRKVTLWDYTGGSSLGSKRSQTTRNEALFGIAYYNQ